MLGATRDSVAVRGKGMVERQAAGTQADVLPPPPHVNLSWGCGAAKAAISIDAAMQSSQCTVQPRWLHPALSQASVSVYPSIDAACIAVIPST